MAVQCFTVVRALGTSAHHHARHFAHRFVGRHIHHAYHTISHSIGAPHALPAIVCVLAGLAGIGVGSLVAGNGNSRSSDPHTVDGPATTSISFVPNAFGGAPNTSISFAPGNIDDPSDAPTLPLPSEVDSLT